MGFFILILIAFVIVLILLPIVAFTKASRAEKLCEDAQDRIRELERTVALLQRPVAPPVPRAMPQVVEVPQPKAEAAPVVAEEGFYRSPWDEEKKLQLVERPEWDEVPTSRPKPTPAIPPLPPKAEPKEREVEPESTFDWEQFMGAKLFTWIGGIALFFGIAFFLKYSFEHGLISPELRIAIGYLVGAGLLGGGIAMRRKETAVTAQTLCSTGILTLYGVTFAAHALYHFSFFDSTKTFLLMAVITAGAFFLSVRLNALSVAILGLAGGFLTPLLLSTGENAPLILFGYIALLDIGLLAVALRKEWNSLTILGTLGTVAMEAGWAFRFFDREQYYADNTILVPMAVFLGFQLLFLGAVAFGKWRGRLSPALMFSAVAVGSVSIVAAFCFLEYPTLGNRPVMLLGFLFLADLALLALIFLDDLVEALEGALGVLLFLFLIRWTASYCDAEMLYAGLAFYFLFALFHTGIPLFLSYRSAKTPSAWVNAFPVLGLVLILIPIFKLATLSFVVWPVILMVNLLAIGVAILTTTLIPIAAVLGVTLVAVGMLIFRISVDLAGLPFFVLTLGGFSLFFMAASHWAVRIIGSRLPEGESSLAVQIPMMAAIMPFLLLIMAATKLGVASMNPIMGLALLLVVVLLGMARWMSLPVLIAIALGCIVSLEIVYHLQYVGGVNSSRLLAWYLGIYGVFTLFPFLFRRHFQNAVIPWAAAAFAGILHFFLISGVLGKMFPWINVNPGVLSAAFAIPAMIGFGVLKKQIPLDSPARNGQLAWFGGVGLFFITLIFPLQFSREWITIGWVLEGVALCALFHRVPHPGLRFTGVFLLTIAFARLALNSAVLSYYVRGEMAVFNWYLYAYGVTAIALFAAAHLLAPPRNDVAGFNVPPILQGFGTLLLFLLLNIEIADYFTAPYQSVLTFKYSGNIARDLSYTIGWALFAFGLLVVGIWKEIRGARFASIGLFLVTLAKLFLHDLWQLDQLYRIAAFIIVPIIAMTASFLYQRFLGARNES